VEEHEAFGILDSLRGKMKKLRLNYVMTALISPIFEAKGHKFVLTAM
jgi:hypothetical protein